MRSSLVRVNVFLPHGPLHSTVHLHISDLALAFYVLLCSFSSFCLRLGASICRIVIFNPQLWNLPASLSLICSLFIPMLFPSRLCSLSLLFCLSLFLLWFNLYSSSSLPIFSLLAFSLFLPPDVYDLLTAWHCSNVRQPL